MRLQPTFDERVHKRKAALPKKSGLQVGASAMDDGSEVLTRKIAHPSN